jgi:hypothetical protein
LERPLWERLSLNPPPNPKPRQFTEEFAQRGAGTALALAEAMASRRAHQAAIAAASDGSVLINVVGLLPEGVQASLQKVLGTAPLFVGIPLNERDAGDVVARLDGAAAEASAHLLGGRAVSPAKSRPRRAKAGKARSSRR